MVTWTNANDQTKPLSSMWWSRLYFVFIKYIYRRFKKHVNSDAHLKCTWFLWAHVFYSENNDLLYRSRIMLMFSALLRFVFKYDSMLLWISIQRFLMSKTVIYNPWKFHSFNLSPEIQFYFSIALQSYSEAWGTCDICYLRSIHITFILMIVI